MQKMDFDLMYGEFCQHFNMPAAKGEALEAAYRSIGNLSKDQIRTAVDLLTRAGRKPEWGESLATLIYKAHKHQLPETPGRVAGPCQNGCHEGAFYMQKPDGFLCSTVCVCTNADAGITRAEVNKLIAKGYEELDQLEYCKRRWLPRGGQSAQHKTGTVQDSKTLQRFRRQ